MIDELRQAVHASPFVPFTITLSDGRRLRARTIDHVHLSPRGATRYIYPNDEHVLWVATLHVTSVDFDQEPAVS